jgi:hypothetical protein
MPKERLRRLPISQPRVKWSDGASSCSRCSTMDVGISAAVLGVGVGFSLGLLALRIRPAVLTYLKAFALSCR